MCKLSQDILYYYTALTSITLRAVGTHDAAIHELDAAAVLGTRAGFAVVRGASDRVSIETFSAELAVAARRVVLADTETWKMNVTMKYRYVQIRYFFFNHSQLK